MDAYDVFYWPDGSWLYRCYFSVVKHAHLGDYKILYHHSSECSIFIIAFCDKKIR
ncbi:hypothetical protein DJ252_23995 [Salmonella enterica subsp. enterica serovar Uzaramo]|nr:hypothetical protein [Salmonella enterica subsp. enterica serovar Uzaramo]EIM6956091.1 hypothetical protein [Salmonella enterica]